MRLFWIVTLWFGLGGPIAAQEVDMSRLPAALPERMIKEMQRRPDKFIEEAAILIMGFGGEAGVDAAGIERSIQLERAWVRSREIRRLMVADLDADQSVTMDEIRVLIAAERAGKRGLLLLGFQAADLDGDAVVTQAELQSHANARAMAGFSEKDAARLRAFMGFDLNSDGLVQLSEVAQVVKTFAPES